MTEATVGESAIATLPEEPTHAVGDVWWTRVGGAAGSRRGWGRGSVSVFVPPLAVGTATAAGRSVEVRADFSLRHGRNEDPEDVCQFKLAALLAMRFALAGSEALTSSEGQEGGQVRGGDVRSLIRGNRRLAKESAR